MNVFWSIYKNLEKDTETLLEAIHYDDNQKKVYSTKSAEIILRAAVEIETISKKLFYENGGVDKLNKAGTKKLYLRYDDDCIERLAGLWKLQKKAVILSGSRCYVTDRKIYPFEKLDMKSGGKSTYTWNAAYQAIKHDRENSLPQASMEELFKILAALYILNLYLKNMLVKVRHSAHAEEEDASFGSNLFTASVHISDSINGDGGYAFKDNFDECIYFSRFQEPEACKIRNIMNNHISKGHLSAENQGHMRRMIPELVLNKHQAYLFPYHDGSQEARTTLIVRTVLARCVFDELIKNPPDYKFSQTEFDLFYEKIESLKFQPNEFYAPGDDLRSQTFNLLDQIGMINGWKLP